MATAVFPADDWEVSDLDSAVDAESVDAILDHIRTDTEHLGTTLALVVVHGGKVVREYYADEVGPDTTLISWSMAKSITHALVGIAAGDGRLGIDQAGLFDEWSADKRSSITLGHLLNMSSGLSWVEDYVDDKISDVIDMLYGDGGFKGDHAAYAIAKSLEADAGTLYKYSSGTTNIVTRVLARALGEAPGSSRVVETFMKARLFDLIGMTSAVPKFDTTGNFVGSSYVYATARDFARFGWLYRNDGVWNGQRILPEGWVDYAGTSIALDPDNGFEYGAHWWIPPEDPGAIAALGYEGQFTWVSPRRDLVLVRLGKSEAALARELRKELGRIVCLFPHVNDDGDRHG